MQKQLESSWKVQDERVQDEKEKKKRQKESVDLDKMQRDAARCSEMQHKHKYMDIFVHPSSIAEELERGMLLSRKTLYIRYSILVIAPPSRLICKENTVKCNLRMRDQEERRALLLYI
jgi:hypothetical protein